MNQPPAHPLAAEQDIADLIVESALDRSLRWTREELLEIPKPFSRKITVGQGQVFSSAQMMGVVISCEYGLQGTSMPDHEMRYYTLPD